MQVGGADGDRVVYRVPFRMAQMPLLFGLVGEVEAAAPGAGKKIMDAQGAMAAMAGDAARGLVAAVLHWEAGQALPMAAAVGMPTMMERMAIMGRMAIMERQAP